LGFYDTKAQLAVNLKEIYGIFSNAKNKCFASNQPWVYMKPTWVQTPLGLGLNGTYVNLP